MTLHLVPVDYATAAKFVTMWHRHLPPPPGHKFSIGVADDAATLRGVAMVGRPVARMLDDGLTLEVNRTATDGAHNANSMLYGACARAAFALGYRRVITYNRADETGTSLTAAGWTVVAERPARVTGWDTPSRPRDPARSESIARTLWEANR